MASRPILFSGPMVRAILDGGKRQTRRMIKHGPERRDGCSKFSIGDRLWVREAWSGEYVFRHIKPSQRRPMDTGHGTAAFPQSVHYWADGNPELGDWERPRPSIHMPRFASRLTLRVTDVQLQRLQNISKEDAIAEGLHQNPMAPEYAKQRGCDWTYPGETRVADPISAFAALWNSINAKSGFGWDVNPWVVAITFAPHPCNINQLEAALQPLSINPEDAQRGDRKVSYANQP